MKIILIFPRGATRMLIQDDTKYSSNNDEKYICFLLAREIFYLVNKRCATSWVFYPTTEKSRGRGRNANVTTDAGTFLARCRASPCVTCGKTPHLARKIRDTYPQWRAARNRRWFANYLRRGTCGMTMEQFRRRFPENHDIPEFLFTAQTLGVVGRLKKNGIRISRNETKPEKRKYDNHAYEIVLRENSNEESIARNLLRDKFLAINF